MQQWPNRSKLRGRTSRNEKTDEAETSQNRKRRSRSRDRDTTDRHSRDRYDSSDRRKNEGKDTDVDRRQYRTDSRTKCLSAERNGEVHEGSIERTRNNERSENKSLGANLNDKIVGSTKDSFATECNRNSNVHKVWNSDDSKTIDRRRKRAHSTDNYKKESTSDDDNVPEQYRSSNFSNQTEKKSKS